MIHKPYFGLRADSMCERKANLMYLARVQDASVDWSSGPRRTVTCVLGEVSYIRNFLQKSHLNDTIEVLSKRNQDLLEEKADLRGECCTTAMLLYLTVGYTVWKRPEIWYRLDFPLRGSGGDGCAPIWFDL